MSESPSFAIIGTGAVGGYYGALLQRAGFDVHFLLNRDFEQVRANGLVIESVGGNFTLPSVHAYRSAADMPECDVVIVALKTTANSALPGILPCVVKKGGIVLTLQNGLGSEQAIAEIVNPDQIIGGLCFLCSNKTGPGHIRHLDYGLITLGEYRPDQKPGGITPRLEKLDEILKSAGISAQPIEDLPLARWKKLVWNIPFNGLSVVKNQLTDQLVKNPATRELCLKLMYETAAAAAACARPINPGFIEKMVADTEKMEPYSPSMKLDFDRGNKMELDAIYRIPIETAKQAGVEMPETEKLYCQLLALN